MISFVNGMELCLSTNVSDLDISLLFAGMKVVSEAQLNGALGKVRSGRARAIRLP